MNTAIRIYVSSFIIQSVLAEMILFFGVRSNHVIKSIFALDSISVLIIIPSLFLALVFGGFYMKNGSLAVVGLIGLGYLILATSESIGGYGAMGLALIQLVLYIIVISFGGIFWSSYRRKKANLVRK